MRARDLLRWKRALNEIKFKHEELELVKEICDDHGVDFQMFMEEYCAKNSIDLKALNQKRGLSIAKQKAQENQVKEIEQKTEQTRKKQNKPRQQQEKTRKNQKKNRKPPGFPPQTVDNS